MTKDEKREILYLYRRAVFDVRMAELYKDAGRPLLPAVVGVYEGQKDAFFEIITMFNLTFSVEDWKKEKKIAEEEAEKRFQEGKRRSEK